MANRVDDLLRSLKVGSLIRVGKHRFRVTATQGSLVIVFRDPLEKGDSRRYELFPDFKSLTIHVRELNTATGEAGKTIAKFKP